MLPPPPARTFDDRVEPRDEVLYRSRVTLRDRRVVAATVVNLSPHGLMARVDQMIAVGEWVRVALPVIGTVRAVVRWCLGGRIGCQLEHEIAGRHYAAVLAAAPGDRRAGPGTAAGAASRAARDPDP